MNTTQTAAASFLAAARKHGFAVSIRDGIVSISKSFAPGDKAAFCECDCIGPMVLDLVPLKGGSVWGTDGGSVGGYSAVANGRYTLNKSGRTGLRFVAALAAALSAE